MACVSSANRVTKKFEHIWVRLVDILLAGLQRTLSKKSTAMLLFQAFRYLTINGLDRNYISMEKFKLSEKYCFSKLLYILYDIKLYLLSLAYKMRWLHHIDDWATTQSNKLTLLLFHWSVMHVSNTGAMNIRDTNNDIFADFQTADGVKLSADTLSTRT